MTRWFNIAGPCDPREHYMIPPERRLTEARALIEQGRFFSLVSGRQTGKTTSVLWLLDHLNADGERSALWVDLQTAREQPDPAAAFRAILGAFGDALARDLPAHSRPDDAQVEAWLRSPARAMIEVIRFVCAASAKPVVIFFDEADCLVGPAMVSFLTQLREMYLTRGRSPGPRAVVIVGQRAVRDYMLSVDDRRHVPWLGTASPFNVTVENVGLAPFTEAEVAELAAQHTAETGQRFDPEALARVYDLSRGHPWLVNALCDQCTRRDVTDRAVAVTAAHIDAAKETLILERRTHIDSLLARLREDRVRRVIDPMIAGETVAASQLDDDIAYVIGLGLCRVVDGRCAPSNPIYREVILRTLTWGTQVSLYQETAWYVRPDGSLDVPKLMAAWQTFWRKDGHLAAEGFSYKESGPHLMLMAFLQRVVNGGGRVEREYALGKGALDLLVEWRVGGDVQRAAVEVKLRRDTETEEEALAQVAGYLASLGLDEGWLVLFDLRSTAPWSERLFTRERRVDGRVVRVVGC
ncbi:MAG: AAA-like domain-containing protein [Polyangiales bacterium]